MKELESMVRLTRIARFSLHSLKVAFSQETCRLSCVHKHVHMLKTMEGTHLHYSSNEGYSHFSLVVSLSKHAFRIQNLYLFINCNIENSIAIVYWKSGD